MCHPTESINGILTGIVKQLKRIFSNDSDFLEQSKIYSAYLAARNHKPKEIIRAFEKINNQPRSTFQQKRAKSKIKPVSIMKHFIDSCTDTVNYLNTYLRFILINFVTNTENSSKEEIDDLFLEKEKLCSIQRV